MSQLEISAEDLHRKVRPFGDDGEQLSIASKTAAIIADRSGHPVWSRQQEVAPQKTPTQNNSIDEFQQIFELLSDAVVILDECGRVIRCNLSANDLLAGIQAGDLWRDIIAREFSPISVGGLVALNDGRLLNVSTKPLGYKPGQLVVLNEITGLHEFIEMRHRCERLTSMGQMVASLAHQLRTPLSTALLYATHIRDQENLEDTHRKRISSNVVSSLGHLKRLINDMLIYASGGQRGTDECNIKEMLDEVKNDIEPFLNEQHCQLDINNTSSIKSLMGNKDALKGVFTNLVINAIQACDSSRKREQDLEHNAVQDNSLEIEATEIKSNVSISLLDVKTSSEQCSVKITVSDNGIGVPKDALGMLFEPFFTTKKQGTGLGLAVVKAVVNAHDGEVWAESLESSGTQVHMVLPVKK